MPRLPHTVEQIIAKLRETEVAPSKWPTSLIIPENGTMMPSMREVKWLINPLGTPSLSFVSLAPTCRFTLLIPLSLSRVLDTLAGGGWVASSSRRRKKYVGSP